MFVPRFHNRIGKVCALAAATLILPVLAYAQNTGGNQGGNTGGNQGNNPPRAPEANAGWVLVPIVGAALFFSTRRLFRSKA
jgi:hypothetical protein